MNDTDIKILQGQFIQLEKNITAIIQNEVRKLIDEQRKQCHQEFENLHERVNKQRKTNKTMSFLGGVVGGIATWGSVIIYKFFK